MWAGIPNCALLAVALSSLACNGGAAPQASTTAAAAPAGATASERTPPLPEPKLIADGVVLLPTHELAVELPEPPAPERLRLPEVPQRYENGAWSVRGLREDLDEQLAAGEDFAEVEVEAWVQQVHRPPPDCPPLPKCLAAHLVVGDEPIARGRRLSLTVDPGLDGPELTLEVGQRVRLRGRFTRVGPMGLLDELGVLELYEYRLESAAGVADAP